MSQVEAVAVEVVIASESACDDRARAEAALASALAGARGPLRGPSHGARWTVHLRVSPRAAGAREGAATIFDDRGAVVAERIVGGHSPQACASLARAAGIWASLVLDDEMARAHDEVSPPHAASDPSSSPATSSAPVVAFPAPARSLAPNEDDGADSADAQPARGRRARTFEVGMLGYLRDGVAATSGAFGVSPFANVELSPGWFVRPSLSLGASTIKARVAVDEAAAFVHYGFRSDACRRIPGNYIERRGMELDLCLGGELAHVEGRGQADASAFRASVGPSTTLRGELGARTNLELRLLGAYNLARRPLAREGPAPALYAAVELGLSWRFR